MKASPLSALVMKIPFYLNNYLMPPFQPYRDLNGLYRVEHFSAFDSFFNASTNVSLL